jgi:prephenate dehydrogenase
VKALLEFEKAGIIGTGLIGGSLAMALKKHGWSGEIIGYDLNREGLAAALEAGAIDIAADDPAELASQAGLIVIAVPVRTIISVLRDISPNLGKGSLVVDVGSTKANIMAAARELVPEGATFVGGHPMAGSEQKGFSHADPDLFRDAAFIFTPPPDCDPEVYSFITQTFTSIGARVMFMNAETHDHAVSLVSHLPHVLAFALVNMVTEANREVQGMTQIISGGFRDMTRIASSDVSLWVDILLENRREVEKAIELFHGALEEIKEDMRREDAGALAEMMRKARSGRLRMVPALRESVEDLFALSVPVENRPGAVFRITQALGEKGVNLEDIEIAHPLEGGRGLLRLYVRGKNLAERSREILSDCGFPAGVEKAVGTT